MINLLNARGINLLSRKDQRTAKECFICGRRGNGIEEHHAVPQRRGGSDEPENVYDLCGGCHGALEKIYDDAFYERLGIAEARVEAFEQAGDGIEGHEVDAGQSPDRQLPVDSLHVIYDFSGLEDDEEAVCIHCGYCNSGFRHYEHALAAQHLRIVHRIEDPYERAPLDRLTSTRWAAPMEYTGGEIPGSLATEEWPPQDEERERLQELLDRIRLETEGE